MKELKKVLICNLYFELPDDFEGTFNDALKCLIKHREDKELPCHPVASKKQDFSEDMKKAHETFWNNFIDQREDKYSLYGNYGIVEKLEGKMVWKENKLI